MTKMFDRWMAVNPWVRIVTYATAFLALGLLWRVAS